MADTSDDSDQSEFEPIFDHITIDELVSALDFLKIDKSCNLCHVDRWFVAENEDGSLTYSYLMAGDPSKGATTQSLSYFTRMCLNCGNMQNFGRVIIDSRVKKMKGLQGG